MALQPRIIACGNTIATFAMAVRFFTGPAVMAAASIAVGLRGTLLHIAIVQVRNRNTECYLIDLPTFGTRNFDVTNVVFKFSGSSSTRNCPFCLCQGIQCSS